jgi:hypothetical protein
LIRSATKVTFNVRALHLDGTHRADVVLSQIERLTGIKHVSLTYSDVSDEGLAHLKGLDELERLDVRNTKVTEAGVADLERALPGLAIQR